MWCENCKKSFETDEKNCPECGNELIEYTPILDGEQAELLDINEDALADELNEAAEEVQIDIEATSQLLVTVIGEKEAKRIISLLNDNHIPASCKEAEEQSLDDLDGIEWDDEDFEDNLEDDIEENFEGEDVEIETLTPPQTEEEEMMGLDDTLYDIFVPEADFPEAMSLMLENDKDRDATLIDDLAETILNQAEPFDFEEEVSGEDLSDEDDFEDEEIVEEQVDNKAIEEEPQNGDGEKSKGGFWSLFRK